MTKKRRQTIQEIPKLPDSTLVAVLLQRWNRSELYMGSKHNSDQDEIPPVDRFIKNEISLVHAAVPRALTNRTQTFEKKSRKPSFSIRHFHMLPKPRYHPKSLNHENADKESEIKLKTTTIGLSFFLLLLQQCTPSDLCELYGRIARWLTPNHKR